MSHDAPFAPHDHAACAADALAAARQVCAEKGVRLTEARERVLSILLESHAALGAYEVLERLREDGRAAAPPAAYRALDFLCAHGLAHRIEKLSAFVACGRLQGEAAGAPAFLICRVCRQVAETSAAPALRALAAQAEAYGFAFERGVVEIEGLCPACREDRA
ncbi:MAG: transcriptional repressor [Pseudomonadota bacterium]